MALTLEEIQWEDPTIPLPPRDAAFEELVRSIFGFKEVPYAFLVVAGNPWLRMTMVDGQRTPAPNLSERLQNLAVLVTSQESACRFCYGAARTQMRLLGYDEEFIDKVERSAVTGDALDQDVIRFCRTLSRSNPRPARQDALALQKHGLSSAACAELAGMVAAVCLHNRVTTLLAVPPQLDFERLPRTFMGRMLRPFIARSLRKQPRPPEYSAPVEGDPFWEVTSLLEGSPIASTLQHALQGAFESKVLPARTKALMFLVVARFLACGFCERLAGGIAVREGLDTTVTEDVLRTLASPALDPVERQLIPWVRDTVRVDQPALLQKRTRALVDSLGSEVLVEAIGVAGLANSMVRLAMLAE